MLTWTRNACLFILIVNSWISEKLLKWEYFLRSAQNQQTLNSYLSSHSDRFRWFFLILNFLNIKNYWLFLENRLKLLKVRICKSHRNCSSFMKNEVKSEIRHCYFKLFSTLFLIFWLLFYQSAERWWTLNVVLREQKILKENFYCFTTKGLMLI